MFLNEFNQTPAKKISKLNKMLNEQFGINIKTSFPSKKRLKKLHEHAEMMLIQMRNSSKKFHLDPEYAKFLGIRDVTDTMIEEGIYAESPVFQEMKGMITASVKELMDSGYTMDEACSECMNRFRMDNRFAYDDEFVLPIVLNAAKQYSEACGTHTSIEDDVMPVQTEMNDRLLRELARECGVKLSNAESVGMIEKKVESFAKAAGKTRDSVVGFLNTLDENSLANGIQMFGRKIAETNKYNRARREAVQLGETEFEDNCQTYSLFCDQPLDESMSPDQRNAKRRMSAFNKSRDALQKAIDDGDQETINKYKKKGGLLGTAARYAKPGQQQNEAAPRKVPSNYAAMMAKKKKAEAKKKEKTKEGKNMGMFDDIINELLNEEVDVEQAEVVMAVRALASDIQDQVERIGRMINEDLPAITDQMRSEMGASTAQSFSDTVTGLLSSHLEATRNVKSNLDQSVSGMTGGEDAGLGGLGDTGMPPADVSDGDTIDAEFGDEVDDNLPAASGPEDAPLGRAAV